MPVQTTQLENGLTLLVESIPEVQSAAFSLLLPAGSAYESEGANGTAAALCDWMFRGAGSRSHRELSAACDALGLQAHESVTSSHLVFQGACLASQLREVLALYGDIVRRPTLPEDQFEATLQGVAQSLMSLEDDPRQKVMVELTRRCFPHPWNRPPEGSLEDLEELTPESIHEHFLNCVSPREAILGVAGNVSFDEVLQTVQLVYGDWEPTGDAPALVAQPGSVKSDHLSQESTQTQIGVAYRAVPYRHPDYYAAWAAVNILSGGMSSRLNTEVREKRGLCYSVYATLSSLRDAGFVLCYAGTTNERAAETLEVLLGELARLSEGVGEDELRRCQARAKSALIMSQESTSARAGSIARDWYHRRRVMSLEEIRRKIEALTPQHVLEYVHSYPAADFTVLTIGPEAISVEPRRE